MAFRSWAPLTEQYGPEQAVLIARDNDMRERLNEAARGHRAGLGEFGPAPRLKPGTPSREPIRTGTRAIASRSVSPKPRAPVPPTIATCEAKGGSRWL